MKELSRLGNVGLISLLLGMAGPQAGAAEAAPADASAKPLYQMTPREVDGFLRQLHQAEPDLRKRAVIIARRNLGQPYKLNLLGEFPFEIHDDQPLCSLEHGDCVVFAEHNYAMALSPNWPTFFSMLQRIRYKDGEISVLTRNHYTLADWNPNNAWLLSDLTSELDGCQSEPVIEHIDRTAFFKKAFGVEVQAPVQDYETAFVPAAKIKLIAARLKDGDCVNFIRGRKPDELYCGHVGMIAIGSNGEADLIHSIEPRALEQPLVAYVEDQLSRNVERRQKGQVQFYGLKFLRLRENALQNLVELDGADAPKVTGPRGLLKR